MKIKEASQRTGLTRKTIRFYESEGLLAPSKTLKNGREYREYTEQEIRQLLNIATLRRARFTVDEIRRMQEEPGETRQIFHEYRERIRQERQELEQILTLTDNIPEEELTSAEALVEQVETAARELPLPRVDVHPRFRYLDEMEAAGTRGKKVHMTEEERRQHRIAAENAAIYAGFSVQNAPGNNMAAGGKGGGLDIGNAQKIAAFNLLMNSRDE